MNSMTLDFADLWRVIWRRKLLLGLATILGAAAALAMTKALPVTYTSEAMLEVESQAPLVRELGQGNAITTPDQVRTEADILQSRSLADAVVRDLGLATNPAFKMEPRDPTWIDWLQSTGHAVLAYLQGEPPADPVNKAVELFGRRLQVAANEKSHIVAVRVTTGSPALSADATNDLLKRYMDAQVDSNLQVSAAENDWLTQHLAALQNEVREAEHKAQAFRDANRLMDVQAGAIPTIQLNEQENALSAARQELARAQAAYDTAIHGGRSGNFAGQEALSSPLIQGLRQREAEVAQRLANLRQRYGDSNPFLGATQAELAAVRQQIAEESAKIVVSLRRDAAVAQDRVKNLQLMVADSQAAARHSVSAAATLAQLTQEVEAKRHVYTAFLTRMEQTQLASTKFPAARVVSPAVPPARSDGLPPPIIMVLGAGAGLFLGMAALLMQLVASSRIGSSKDVAALTGTLSIGSMPALPGVGATPVPMRILDMAQEGVVETLRALRYAAQARNPGIACHRLLVTSSVPGEGKSTLAATLARLSAADGQRVLLIEADLRRPQLRRLLLAEPAHSLEDLLNSDMAIADAVHVDDKSGLHCLLADGTSANPQPLLQSARFIELIKHAQLLYDLVVIDSPPVMRVIDAAILSAYSDVILFAIAWESTPRALVTEALRRFPLAAQSRIATVITRVPQKGMGDQGYYEGYGRRRLSASV